MAKLRGWQWNQVGLYFAATIYNVYIQSTLGFTAQVARTTEAVEKKQNGQHLGEWHPAQGDGSSQRTYGT